MIHPLKELVTIQPGYVAKPSPVGNIGYLQSSHFREGEFQSDRPIPYIDATQVSQRHLLQPGDVLFAAKGVSNFAGKVPEVDMPIVASSSLLVLRILPNAEVLPEYLMLWLNLMAQQNKLQHQGTSIRSINKETLGELEIPVPDFTLQEKIVELNNLAIRERQLLKEIADHKQNLIAQVILKAATA